MRPEFIILFSLLSWHFNLLYSLLNETLWNIQTPTWRRSLCVCVCVFVPSVFLHISECVSAVFDPSISGDRQGSTFPAHLHTGTIQVDTMICYSRVYHPSWWWVKDGSGSISPREMKLLAGCVGLTLGLVFSYWIPALPLSFPVCLSQSTTLNQAELLIKIHIFSALNVPFLG